MSSSSGGVGSPWRGRSRRRQSRCGRWAGAGTWLTRRDEPAETRAGTDDLEHLGVRFAHELKNSLTGVKALVQLGLRNADETPSHGRLAVIEKEITRMQEILKRLPLVRTPAPGDEAGPHRLRAARLRDAARASGRAAEARVAAARSYGEATSTPIPNASRRRSSTSSRTASRPLRQAARSSSRCAGRATGPESWSATRAVECRPRRCARVGTPFFTTREDGTGLGVVHARSVIARRRILTLESEPGRETTVRATLPSRVGVGAIAAAAS